METDYPWDGRVKISVTDSCDRPWKLSLRVPDWCQNFVVKINDQVVNGSLQKGYLTIECIWKAGDVLEVEFAMPPLLIEANPRIDSVRGCVALQRGPIVYCWEGQDQEPGVNLLDLEIDLANEWTSHWRSELLGGVMVLEGAGYQLERSGWAENKLYRPMVLGNENQSTDRKVKLTAIPYYAWGNRSLRSMRVWMPVSRR
jgi:DUF1680 family protein